MLLRKVENPKLIYNKKAAEVQDNPIWVALLEQCTINFTWQNLSEKLTLIFLSPRVVTCHLNMLCNMQKAGIKDQQSQEKVSYQWWRTQPCGTGLFIQELQ